MSRGVLVKAGVLLALVAAAVALQLSVGLPSQAELRSTLDGLGGWGCRRSWRPTPPSACCPPVPPR